MVVVVVMVVMVVVVVVVVVVYFKEIFWIFTEETREKLSPL